GEPKVCHAKEFADAMLEPTIEKTIVDGARIIGYTFITLMEQPALLENIIAEFSASITTGK
ncbi:MAG: M20 family peptidase, partial [Veillonella caviae]|nr:M20 family peptidase [Veillonella caviae]